MKPVVIYGIIAVIVVVVISYLYATRASEAYIDQPFNLIVVDANGNMSSVTVRPPSLNGVPPTSNVVCTDELGNGSGVCKCDTNYMTCKVLNSFHINSYNIHKIIILYKKR